MRATTKNILWPLAYLAMVTAVIGGGTWFRTQTLAVYGTDEAQTAWNQWRDDAAQRAKSAGPVKQRVPKSVEPPALVLMRDYFAVCLGLALLLSSVLFGTFMFFIRGALRTRPFVDRSPS